MHTLKKVSKSAICFTLLFLVDLVSVFREYVPVAAMKIFVYAVSFVLLIKMTRHAKIKSNNHTLIYWSLTTVYFVLLLIRLVFDFVIPWKGFFMYTSPLTILFFYFATMVIPCYFIRRLKENFDYLHFSLYAGICLCVYLTFSYNEIVSGTIEAINTGGQFAGGSGTDVISYGHMGVSLIIIAVYRILAYSKKTLWVSLIFMLSGLSAIVLSGSRSPFIALAVCIPVLLKSKFSRWYYLPVVMVIVALFVNTYESLFVHVNDYLNSVGIGSFNRVVNTFVGGGAMEDVSSGRDDIWAVAWNLVLQNPVLGSSYLLPDNSYAHNIFIEQFMALGFVGGVVFIMINLKTLYLGWKTLEYSPQSALTYALFLQYLILGCFSKTIIALGAYWLFMFVTITNYERSKIQQYSFSYNSNL